MTGLPPVELLAIRERAAQGLPQLAGDQPTTGRLAIGEASEAACRHARRHADAVATLGAPFRAMEFRRCTGNLTIVRLSAGGIDGGWAYASRGTLDVEWSEIVTIALRWGKVDLRGGA